MEQTTGSREKGAINMDQCSSGTIYQEVNLKERVFPRTSITEAVHVMCVWTAGACVRRQGRWRTLFTFPREPRALVASSGEGSSQGTGNFQRQAEEFGRNLIHLKKKKKKTSEHRELIKAVL